MSGCAVPNFTLNIINTSKFIYNILLLYIKHSPTKSTYYVVKRSDFWLNKNSSYDLFIDLRTEFEMKGGQNSSGDKG